jgi:cohesin loading factor subunit SCC2
VTPRKRKSPDELITPSQKRIHVANSTQSTPTNRPGSEASSHVSSKTPRQLLAYVNVPAPAWKTPSRKSSKPPDHPVSGDESDEDYHYAHRDNQASVKSSARRTGDRDERGNRTILAGIF